MPSLEVVEIVESSPAGQGASAMESDDDKGAVTTMEEIKEVELPISTVPTKEDKPSVTKALSKKRSVTPLEDDGKSKKKQQQCKAGQKTLSDFFFGQRQPASSPQANSAKNEKPCKQKTQNVSIAAFLSKVKERKNDSKTQSEDPLKESEQPGKSGSEGALLRKEKDQGTEQTKVQNKTEESCLVSVPPRSVPAPENSKGNASFSPTSKVKAAEMVHEEATQPVDRTEDNATTVDLVSNEGKPVVNSSLQNDCTEKEVEESDPVEDLSEDQKALLEKHNDMRTRYSRRAEELVAENKEGLNEENFKLPEPQQSKMEGASDEEFPDEVLANVALLIEGSSLPLSKLATHVCQTLEKCHNRQWPTESVNEKIKLFAKRKPYLNALSTKGVDLFENDEADRMWRWENTMLDLLPSESLTMVRKARSARKKLLSHHTSTMRLLQSLNEADTLIKEKKMAKLEGVLAKVSRDEEKVLKFEREAEKQRLAELAKKKKQEELESKRREKEQLAEEKRLEKERKKKEAEDKKLEVEKKKMEAAKAREEEKRKKTEEREKREEQKKKEEEQKNLSLNKQKACLMSFFGSTKEKQLEVGSKSEAFTTKPEKTRTVSDIPSEVFDDKDFRSKINSLDSFDKISSPFGALSLNAKASRKRRTRRVPVSVYVTVMPEGGAWDAQPFAEHRVITIPNKYRFLSFHEDCRPPYHGTWSKKSSIVNGRNPFRKDTSHLDYDYDSEAEWEEGDDEIGEDIEDEAKNQEEDEEGDVPMYDYDDGFCVADEQYLEIDENVDEETKALYKKKLKSGENVDEQAIVANTVGIIAPAVGGIPLGGNSSSASSQIEGFQNQEGLDFLLSHQVLDLMDVDLCLDAFPPALVDEGENNKEAGSPSRGASGKDEYTLEELKLLARFAHHCTLNSKEKVIEELRNAHPSVFASRAKATRKLDSIAIKKRRTNVPGVYWEVKREVLSGLQLLDLLEKQMEGEGGDAVVANDQKSKKKKSASGQKKKKSASGQKKKTGTKKEPSKKGVAKKGASPKGAAKKGKKRKTPEVKGGQEAKKEGNCEESVKKKVPPSMAASANLLAGFLIKKKAKPQPDALQELDLVAAANKA